MYVTGGCNAQTTPGMKGEPKPYYAQTLFNIQLCIEAILWNIVAFIYLCYSNVNILYHYIVTQTCSLNTHNNQYILLHLYVKIVGLYLLNKYAGFWKIKETLHLLYLKTYFFEFIINHMSINYSLSFVIIDKLIFWFHQLLVNPLCSQVQVSPTTLITFAC